MTTSAASERLTANLVLTWHPVTAEPVDPVEVPLNEHVMWYPEELGEFRLSTREAPPTADATPTELAGPDAGSTNCWTVVGRSRFTPTTAAREASRSVPASSSAVPTPRYSCSPRIRPARWLRCFRQPQRNATSSRNAAMGERLRWKIVHLVTRLLPGQCWPGMVSWALDGPRHARKMGDLAVPWRPINSTCRSELPRTGTCYCGALRREVPKQLADQLRTMCCHAPVVLGPCKPGESDEEFWLFDLRCARCGRDVGSLVQPSMSWARLSREAEAAADAPGQVGGS